MQLSAGVSSSQRILWPVTAGLASALSGGIAAVSRTRGGIFHAAPPLPGIEPGSRAPWRTPTITTSSSLDLVENEIGIGSGHDAPQTGFARFPAAIRLALNETGETEQSGLDARCAMRRPFFDIVQDCVQ